MKLYSSPLSPYSARCRMAVYAKGLEFELVDMTGKIKSAEYASINPIGKIPALELDGRVIPESDAICEFLEDVYPEPHLLPEDPGERATVRIISRVADLYVLKPILTLTRFLSLDAKDSQGADEAISSAQSGLDLLAAYFADSGPYAAGPKMSLADCMLVPALLCTEAFGHICKGCSLLAGQSEVADYWTFIKSDQTASRVAVEMNDHALSRFDKVWPASGILD